jgi:hypothetical protein
MNSTRSQAARANTVRCPTLRRNTARSLALRRNTVRSPLRALNTDRSHFLGRIDVMVEYCRARASRSFTSRAFCCFKPTNGSFSLKTLCPMSSLQCFPPPTLSELYTPANRVRSPRLPALQVATLARRTVSCGV